MNKYVLTGALALLILVIALPVYGYLEPTRMARSQEELRQQYVSDAAVLYIENCAVCHGIRGEGIGPNPPLDNPDLREADYETLFKTIARGRYGTAMGAWHIEEGGIFNDYQIQELVALIRYGDWSQVGELAAQRGVIPPTLPVPEVGEDLVQQVMALGPEGELWAQGMQLYAQNCTTCHGVNGEGSDLGVPLNTEDVREKDADILARTIREGVPGTLMAAWKNTLSNEDIEAIVAFLKNWDRINEAGLVLEPPEPIHIDVNNPEEMLALGERIFTTTCTACHGEDGTGGIGPAINSQQFLSRHTDDQIRDAIVYGGRRPNSRMPAFGDRLTSVEIDALVAYIRSLEPTAPWVANPRGSGQGGGPPWLQATPDANNPIAPGMGRGRQNEEGNMPGMGGPPWRRTGTPVPQDHRGENMNRGPALRLRGEVVRVEGNRLTFQAETGQTVEVMLGPPWFWEEKGIALHPGDIVELEGFESPDHMEVNWVRNVSTGETVQLRTDEGMPVWNQTP